MRFSSTTYSQPIIRQSTPVVHRGLLLFLTWLFIGPLATQIITIMGPKVQVFEMATNELPGKRVSWRGGYFAGSSSATLTQLLEPTRTIVGLFVAVFLLNSVVRHSFGDFDKTEFLMGAFVFILLVSVVFKSKVLGFSVRVASDAFVVPFLAYFIARRLIAEEDHFRRLCRAMAYMGVYVIVICLIERMLHDDLFYQLTGPFRFSTALYTSISLVFFVVLCDHIAASCDGRPAIPRGVRRFVLYSAPFIVLLLWSRGSWIGFVSGVSIVFFLGRRLMALPTRIGLLGSGLVLAATILFGLDSIAEILGGRIGNSHTIYGRFATWSLAINEGFSAPFVGIGLNNLRDVLVTNVVEFGGIANFPSIHNSYLEILAEQGVVGLLLYLAILGSIISFGISLKKAGLIQRDKWRGITVIGIMAGYAIPAIFASTAHDPGSIAHVFVYSFCGAVAGRYGRGRRGSPPRVGHSIPVTPHKSCV